MSRQFIELPSSNGDAIRFQTSLSGVFYRFHFEFNVLDDSWFFRLEDAGGNVIAAGIRCTVEYSLLSRVTDPRKPAGTLVLVDTAGTYVDPGQKELFGRVKLCYDDGIEI